MMRTRLLTSGAGLALAAAALLAGPARAAPAHDVDGPTDDLSIPRGLYVEARTAAVFAGACHYGGQLTTQGREAVVAWCFEGGTADGVALAGVDVVCAVTSAQNLTQGAERSSIVYVSADASAARRAAAVALVRSRYAELLGDVRAVRPAPIVRRVDERGYAVAIEGVLAIEGRRVPDRCCRMELQVWYAPFGSLGRSEALGRDVTAQEHGERLGCGDVEDVEVGCNAVFRYDERSLGPVWDRRDENNGFVGRFAFRERAQP